MSERLFDDFAIPRRVAPVPMAERLELAITRLHSFALGMQRKGANYTVVLGESGTAKPIHASDVFSVLAHIGNLTDRVAEWEARYPETATPADERGHMHETNAILRAAALLAAVLHDPEDDDVLPTAQAYHHWLTGPHPATTAILVAGTPVSRTQQEGTPVSLVMPDNDQVTITVAALDAEKVPVPDSFTDPAGIYLAPFSWAVDNTALGVLTVSADTLSVVLDSAVGQTGTVTVTATDVNGKAVPSFSVEIDPSAAASAGLVAGTPVPRTDTPAG